jgi:phosphatidate cytidylyltransferase
MELTNALTSWPFWSYTAATAVLLAAAWAGLFRLGRRGQHLEDLRRLYWSLVLLAVVTVIAVFLGKEAFVLIVAAVSVFACKEFARATGLYADWLFTGLVYLGILAVNFVALWAGILAAQTETGENRGYDIFMATPIYAVAVLCLLPVARNRSEGMLQRVALSVMAFVYFGFFLAHLSLLAGIPRADQVYGYVFFLIFGTATADVAGRLAGRFIGRHPVAKHISPDTTWEGAAASWLWACLWSFTLGWTLPQPQFGWVAMLLSAVLFGIMGPLGDLVMRYILSDLGLPTEETAGTYVPYLALGHLHRLIFVAPLFFRLIHWYDPHILVSG